MCEEVSAPKPFAGGAGWLLNTTHRTTHTGICKSPQGLQTPSSVFLARQRCTEPCRQLRKQLDALGPGGSWMPLPCSVRHQRGQAWRKRQFGFQSLGHTSIPLAGAAAKRGDDSCGLPWRERVYSRTAREKASRPDQTTLQISPLQRGFSQ